MRVSSVRSTIVRVPYREASFSAIDSDAAATEVIVQVETDEGLSGIGESLATFCPEAVDAAVRQMAKFVAGQSPFEIESSYCWLQRQDPLVMAEEARRGREQGFTIFYLKVGIEPRADLAVVEAVRAGVGADALLRVDANGAWSTAEAVKIIRELTRYAEAYHASLAGIR